MPDIVEAGEQLTEPFSHSVSDPGNLRTFKSKLYKIGKLKLLSTSLMVDTDWDLRCIKLNGVEKVGNIGSRFTYNKEPSCL